MAEIFDLSGKRVWVAGHQGMVGAALIRRLASSGAKLLTVARAGLDLRCQADVDVWMATHRPEVIFLAAATVGGIAANLAYPSAFIYDNLAIATNVIGAAAKTGVEKLMFLGSACIYPRLAAQPIAETSLLTGILEPSNEGYALAKLAGIGLCQAYRRQYGHDFISVIPTNLYGPGDKIDLATSHVIPALIHKVVQAQTMGAAVEIWGTGAPRREFLHVDDAADAMVFLMQRYSSEEIINIGGGEDISVCELADLIGQELGFKGAFHYDTSRPDGMPRKQLDAARLFRLGWRPRIGLRDGLAETCRWIIEARAQPA
jgi:GDP-L-fucose synthase